MRIAPRRSHGVTLWELLVTVSIVAALAGASAPTFRRVGHDLAMRSAANGLHAAMHFARSTAIRRGRPAIVCVTRDGRSCMAGSSATGRGWLVLDGPQNRLTTGGAPGRTSVLRREWLPTDFRLRASRPVVTFWPASRSGSTSTLTLCDVSGLARARAVIVSQTGRPRIAGGRSCP